MTTAADTQPMARALELAASVRASTPPNPWVGCVIEAADGTRFEGATHPVGGPHAEAAAIGAAGAHDLEGATAWVTLAASGAAIERRAGPHTVTEDEPYPLRIEVRAGALPPPGGELIEPLLGWPVPIAGRWSRRVRINVRFQRRGRRVLVKDTP